MKYCCQFQTKRRGCCTSTPSLYVMLYQVLKAKGKSNHGRPGMYSLKPQPPKTSGLIWNLEVRFPSSIEICGSAVRLVKYNCFCRWGMASSFCMNAEFTIHELIPPKPNALEEHARWTAYQAYIRPVFNTALYMCFIPNAATPWKKLYKNEKAINFHFRVLSDDLAVIVENHHHIGISSD